MSSSCLRRSALALVCAAAFLSACGGGTSEPATCSTQADCAAGLQCTQNECLAPGQCPSTVQSCQATTECPSAQECQSGCCIQVAGCATSSDCTDPTRPHCDPATKACKPCGTTAQCAAGKVCNAGKCEPFCKDDTECKTPGKTKCRVQGGLNYCAECNLNADCATAAGKPICKDGACFGCTSNASCSGATPVCDDASKNCVTCLESQNASGVNAACTNAAKPACVAQACQTCAPSSNAATTGINGACPSATPVCTSAFTCTVCTADSHCGVGGVCVNNTCTGLAIETFTSSAATIGLNATATLTITLTLDVTASTTIPVVISSGGGTLSAANITIASGNSGTVTYTAPATATAAVITATLNGTKTVSVAVSDAPVAMSSITPATIDLQAGRTAQLEAVLNLQPAAATSVTLTSLNPTFATVPATVSVPNTSDRAAFTVTGVAAGAATIQGSFGGADKTATVNVYAVSIASVSGPSGAQPQGSDVTMTVALAAAPPTDAIVAVGANNGATIGGSASGTVTIAKSTTSKTFTVKLGTTGPVTVTASANGSTQSTTVSVATTGGTCAPGVVISGIYGGGGGSGTYKCDLVELHNRTATAQAIGTWSLQYGSGGGTTTNAVFHKLPATASIPAGGYLLIQEDCGTSTKPDYSIPPDITAVTATTGSLSISQSGGKVFLVNVQDAAITLAASGCPDTASTAKVVDFVGWGATTNCGEGGHVGGATANTDAIMRNGSGCTDTNDSLADFTKIDLGTTPTPLHNSGQTPLQCTCQ